MIYGAYGYTGGLVIEEALRRGHKPVLAGRDVAKINALAEKYGLETRVFGLDDLPILENVLDDIDVVAHVAGPFAITSKPMVDACLATKTHYLDITGEVPVFEAVFARDAEAKEAGVSLIPGVGFDVVPTDCLAAMLKERMPEAVELELAIGGFGAKAGGVSRGTLKTMIEHIGSGTFIRRDGKYKAVPSTWHTDPIPYPKGPSGTVTIPWGDLASAYWSTGIPNIATYMQAKPGPFKAIDFLRPVLGLKPVIKSLQWLVQQTMTGPSEQARISSGSQFWGRVKDADGKEATLTLTSQEGYTLTAESTVRAVEKVLTGKIKTGALTPSMAFGTDYVRELTDVEVIETD
jgi:short subunit dehydrogenase-like uncharacterized protein